MICKKATACTINVVSTWIVNVLEGSFQDQNIGKALSLVFVVFSGITPRFYFVNNVCFSTYYGGWPFKNYFLNIYISTWWNWLVALSLFNISVFDCYLFSNEIFLSINFYDTRTLLKIVFKANVMLSTNIIGSINDESDI